MQCFKLVIIQFDPLQAMKILKGRRWYIVYPIKYQNESWKSFVSKVFNKLNYVIRLENILKNGFNTYKFSCIQRYLIFSPNPWNAFSEMCRISLWSMWSVTNLWIGLRAWDGNVVNLFSVNSRDSRVSEKWFNFILHCKIFLLKTKNLTYKNNLRKKC